MSGTDHVPDWVLAVIVDLEEHEQVHDHPKDGGHCMAATLEKIPGEMRVYAAAWERGFKAGQNTQLGDDASEMTVSFEERG